MRSLEGANCADLPPAVADKYFDCHVQREPFLAQTAKAICARCVVVHECRDEALTTPYPPTRGVIGGVDTVTVLAARGWRNYELGITARPPRGPRPAWLEMPDAAHRVEQYRLETDLDEPPPDL